MCIDVNLPWTIWRFLLSHPSEPKGNSWGLAIVNPIFRGDSPCLASLYDQHCRMCVCVWNNCMDVKFPWAIWRFLLSRPSEPNSDPSCLAVVNPTHMQGTYTLSNETLHQRGKHPLAIDVYSLVYIMTRFVYMSKAPVVSIFLRCWFMCQRLLQFIINAVGLYAKDSCALYWCGMGLSQEPLSDLLRLGNLVMFLFHGIQFPTDHSCDLVLV